MPPREPQVVPADFSWKLPPSPDHKSYRELLGYIHGLKEAGQTKLAMAWFAAACEADFWLFQWQVMSLGRLEIRDPGHRKLGQLWVMQPWFFDRMREFQDDVESKRTNVLYQFSRGLFKSSGLQKGGSLWLGAKDRMVTIGVFTHKDPVAKKFGGDVQNEIRDNGVLRAHWPQYRRLKKDTDTAIVVDRPPGPREPTFGYHSIVASAASAHYRFVFVDDAVDPEERSPLVMADLDNRISLLTPLGHDDTQRFWIGVPTTSEDPVEKRKKKGDFFTLVRKHPGILPGGEYPMRSKRFYDQWKREMREDHFASQVLLQIIPPGSRYFREEWLRRYNQRPEEVALGSRIHIIIDPAEGKKDPTKKKLSDFLTVRVYAFGFDRRRRNLDLWRERIGIVEATDLLFGPVPGEEATPENLWKIANVGRRGLVGKWLAYDPHLTIWVENVGGSQFDQTIRRDMKNRQKMDAGSPRCVVRELRSNVPKEERIANLQPDYRNGVIEYPARGFGHGSYTTDDNRDVFEQFVEDELKQWTLRGDTLNDDLLDSEAWPAQPGITMPYPDSSPDGIPSAFLAQESALAEASSWGSGSDETWASWRVS